MPDAKQQAPKDMYVHVPLEAGRGIYEYKTLDILAMAGYSKTLARELIKSNKVWQPFVNPLYPNSYGSEIKIDKHLSMVEILPPNNWVLTDWRCWVNFLVQDHDLVLCIQPAPYYEGSRRPIKGMDSQWTQPVDGLRRIYVDRTEK